MQVATQAEFQLGAGKPYKSLLGVFWGTGVGGGLILDGKPWLGRGAAGEIGHTVVKIGGRALRLRPARAASRPTPAAARWRRRPAARRGGQAHGAVRDHGEARPRRGSRAACGSARCEHEDKVATHLIDQAVEALGAGIASALNLLDVEAVVIGGGLGTRLGEPYVERIREAMMPHLFVDDRPPPIHLAALGDLGGAIGAALLAKSGAKAPGPFRRA